jgi:rhamnose utilization protein RhaD (predicted bifunctional aldolase and dehydrogenase)
MTPSAEKPATLLQLAHDLGRESLALALLGEGNVSCRLDADTFLVKASGCSLAHLEERQLVACRFSALLPLLAAGPLPDDEVEKILLDSRVDPSQPKPSVEALFHAYLLSLPGVDVVAHTHPVTVNSILCGPEEISRAFAEHRRFPDEIVCCGARSLLVPYVDPGTILARKIRDETEAFRRAHGGLPRLILLRNHGLIALGATAGSVLAATKMAEKAARIFAGAAALGGAVSLAPENVARIDSRPDEHYRQRMLKI